MSVIEVDDETLPRGGLRVRQYYAPVSTLEVSGGALLLCFVLLPLAITLGLAMFMAPTVLGSMLALIGLSTIVGGVLLEVWRLLARGALVIDVRARTLRVRRTGPAWGPSVRIPTASIRSIAARVGRFGADLVAEHHDGTQTVVVRELLCADSDRLAARLCTVIRFHEDEQRPRTYRG